MFEHQSGSLGTVTGQIDRHGKIKIGKGKVNLSLCLTMYHAMKMYSVLNQTLCHEDVWEMEV
jgi:hypothetical protein